MDTPLFLPIKKIVTETHNVKTYFFPAIGGSASGGAPVKINPGQFVMLWIPGTDQKPFSVGYDDGKQFGLTIFALGKSTNELANMKVGDRVGISGPHGTSFSVKPKTHYIMVGGGYGAAPLGFLAEEVTKLKSTVDFCIGARTPADLLFEKRASKLPGLKLHVATDTGEKGHKGYVTDLVPNLIAAAKKKNILLVTCGPELMEKKVLDMSNKFNVESEMSIERYMKCGFGVCGQCCVDPLGLRMCNEGPVVPKQIANQITEFGIYHRDKSGAKIKF